MLIVGIIVAAGIFIWVNHQQQKRAVDRHNRNIDRQETLLQTLRDKNKTNPNEQ